MDRPLSEPGPEAGAATPSPEEPPPPRKSGLAFFGVVLALFAVLGTLAQTANLALGLAWSQLFALFLPACIVAAGSNLRVREALLLVRRPSAGALAAAAGVGLGGFVGSSALLLVVSLLLPARWLQTFDVSRLFDVPPLQRVAMSLVASLVAPLCEEVAFRGWILTALRTRTSTARAVGWSALLFAFMHLDPVRFAPLVGLGALFGWLTWRAGSIWPAVVAHATNNALGTVLWAAAAWSGAAPNAPTKPSPGEALGAAAGAMGLAVPVLLLATSSYRRATPHPPLAGAALVRRDARRSTEFRLASVPHAQRAAIAAGAASLAGLVLLGYLQRKS